MKMHAHRLPYRYAKKDVVGIDELSSRELSAITCDRQIPRWVRESARAIINDRREKR